MKSKTQLFKEANFWKLAYQSRIEKGHPITRKQNLNSKWYTKKGKKQQGNLVNIKKRKLTVLLLCSAATASPKAIRSITKTRASNNVEAIAQTNEKNPQSKNKNLEK